MKRFSTKIMVVMAALLLSVCLQTYSQNSLDSLVIQIIDIWGYDITHKTSPKDPPIKINNFQDSIFSYGKELRFVPAPLVRNATSSTIFKTDSIGMGCVLINSVGDTIFIKLYKDKGLFNLRTVDTGVMIMDPFAINISELIPDKYNITLWIDSFKGHTFTDSIKKLSSHTTHFSVAKKNAIENVSETNSLKVFPNPASEQLNVTCGEEMRSIALFNTAGQRVRQMEPCGSEVQIPLSGLPHGLYLLHVQTANGSTVRKVVVE